LVDLEDHLLIVLLNRPPPERRDAVPDPAAVTRGADHPAAGGVGEAEHHPDVGVAEPDEELLRRRELVEELELGLDLDPPRYPPPPPPTAELDLLDLSRSGGRAAADAAVALPPPVAFHFGVYGGSDAFHFGEVLC
ncbi:unnamed protein product, partial [Linum tenue]